MDAPRTYLLHHPENFNYLGGYLLSILAPTSDLHRELVHIFELQLRLLHVLVDHLRRRCVAADLGHVEEQTQTLHPRTYLNNGTKAGRDAIQEQPVEPVVQVACLLVGLIEPPQDEALRPARVEAELERVGLLALDARLADPRDFELDVGDPFICELNPAGFDTLKGWLLEEIPGEAVWEHR